MPLRPREVSMKLRIAALLVGVGLVATVTGCGDADKSESRADKSPSASPSAGSPSATPPSAEPSAGTPGGESPSPDVTGAPPPRMPGTPPASRPPQKPTDTVVPGWVVGTITAASSGPCYGMMTDDGAEYALYGNQGFAVHRGQRIRVKVDTLRLKIYCGPGRHAAVKEYEPIR
jgi:hypothetical protein